MAFPKRCPKLGRLTSLRGGGQWTGSWRRIEIQPLACHSRAAPRCEKPASRVLSVVVSGKDPKHEGVLSFLWLLAPVFTCRLPTEVHTGYGEHPLPPALRPLPTPPRHSLPATSQQTVLTWHQTSPTVLMQAAEVTLRTDQPAAPRRFVTVTPMHIPTEVVL